MIQAHGYPHCKRRSVCCRLASASSGARALCSGICQTIRRAQRVDRRAGNCGGRIRVTRHTRTVARVLVRRFFPGHFRRRSRHGHTVAPLTTTVINAADPRHVGVASGINNAVSRIAGLLAIAALTVLVTGLYWTSMQRSLDAVHASPSIRAAASAQRDRLGGARFGDPALQRDSIAAFEWGFRGVALACATLAGIAALADALGIEENRLR